MSALWVKGTVVYERTLGKGNCCELTDIEVMELLCMNGH